MKSKLCQAAFVLVVSFVTASCLSPKGAWPKPTRAALKIQNYQDLIKGLQEHKVGKGTAASTIRTLYGEPDRLFNDASTTGSLEIWTYMNPDKKGGEYKPVRVYFNNGKLIDWAY